MTRAVPISDVPSRDIILREDQLRLGLWMFLATVTMLFAAFASAYIVRRSGSDWQRVTLPAILWTNTMWLAASGVALEVANHFGRRGRWGVAVGGCGAALLGGTAFLAGQIAGWRQLIAVGVYLPTSPHSSFFFMITGAHAVHIVAALAVLVWGLARTRAGAADPRAWAVQMELCRTFWHYLGVVWVCLFALVSLY